MREILWFVQWKHVAHLDWNFFSYWKIIVSVCKCLQSFSPLPPHKCPNWWLLLFTLLKISLLNYKKKIIHLNDTNILIKILNMNRIFNWNAQHVSIVQITKKHCHSIFYIQIQLFGRVTFYIWDLSDSIVL